MTRALYMGCWGGVGHCLRDPDGSNTHPPRELRTPDLDGAYPPGASLPYGKQTPQVEGVAALHHVNGWTILSFWDRSVDERGNSHSTFALEGTHGYDEAVRLAREAFPTVWARYTFEVREMAK